MILFAACLVERRLLRCASMCPLKVASNSGGCFRSFLVVKSGNIVRNPILIAFARVLSVGGQQCFVYKFDILRNGRCVDDRI